MPLNGRKRKALRWGGLLLGGLVLAGLAVPLWFPWVLRPLGHVVGLRYQRYQRVGYSRFSLSGVTLAGASARLQCEYVESYVPTAYLWHWAANPLAGARFLEVRGWQYEPQPSAAASAGSVSNSTFATVLDLEHTYQTWRRWVPVAALTAGQVHWAQSTVRLPETSWINGTLSVHAEVPLPTGPEPVQATLLAGRPFALSLASEPLGARCTVNLTTNATGLDIMAGGQWLSNRFDIQAHFGTSGTLPETGSLAAPDFAVPAALVHLPAYRTIGGSLAGAWRQGQFTLNLDAAARPEPSPTRLPPIQLDFHVRGDTNIAAVQVARLVAPWLTAELDRPVRLHFQGPILQSPVTLSLKGDLTRQAWLPLTGTLEGKAELAPTNTTLPAVRFTLSGARIGYATLAADTLAVHGDFTWPWLTVGDVQAVFSDGSTASVSGRLDCKSRAVLGGALQFSGPLVQHWLPPGYTYSRLSATAAFEGPLAHLAHSGRAEVIDFTSPRLQPLALRLAWRGRQTDIDDFQLSVRSADAAVQAAGAAALIPAQAELRLSQLSLFDHDQAALELVHPSRIILQRPSGRASWDAQIDPLDWSGPAGQLALRAHVDWPAQGNVRLHAQGLSSGLLAGFARGGLPELHLNYLEAAAAWSNGPAAYALTCLGIARFALPDRAGPTNVLAGGPFVAPDHSPNADPKARPAVPVGPEALKRSLLSMPLGVEIALAGDRNGLVISNLTLLNPTSTVAVVRGFVPFTVAPASVTNPVELKAGQPMELTARSQPDSEAWRILAALTGIRLDEPELDLRLTGSWPAPRGSLRLRARKVDIEKGSARALALERLSIVLEVEPDQARLIQGELRVQGQPVLLTGHLPLPAGFWSGLVKGKRPDLAKAAAELHVANAALAAFEPLAPKLLAPQGQMTADIRLEPGFHFAGELAVHNARTRPLAGAGPIRALEARLVFDGHRVKLQRATASIGGAPILLQGEAELPARLPLEGLAPLPDFALQLRGTNVPLARAPEYIIRSDLDLRVTKTNGAPPLVSGAVHLRDSFYLSDLRALIPLQVTAPSERPPYFSIDEPALADWRLAVLVDGARFLNVRSPVFTGTVSANLHLQGTLKEPIALGDLKVDSGLVNFPFASLQLQQGLVSLTSQDPYHPRLMVVAVSKQYGYDITLQAQGTVAAPVIQFTSNPPLSSEQILLMVTAGELPHGAFSLTPQQRAQTMALFLGRDLLSKLGVGDQAQQRLSIRSGEEISEQGRPTYRVEYKLGDNWSLIGEYDRFGDFNAGFKWRVYSR